MGQPYSYTNYDGGGEVEVGGFHPSIPERFRARYCNKAAEEYGNFKKLSLKDQVAQYSRILEELERDRIAKEEAAAAAKRAAEEAARVAREQKNAAINNLLDKYGYDSIEARILNEKIKQSARNAALTRAYGAETIAAEKPNKNFFQRLFGGRK